ncbi:branched-chain amino acid ABC transporter permease [Ensifer canadensis]
MDMFLQQLVNALSLGGTYALLALGLAVVFSIMGLINFAHGELMTAAGYGLCFALLLGVPFPLAIFGALMIAVALAMLMERIAFRPVRGASGTTPLLLTSFAVSAILRVIFQNFISARPKPVPMPESFSGTIEIGGLHLGLIQGTSILVTVIMLVGLNLFLRTTVLGRAMRAGFGGFRHRPADGYSRQCRGCRPPLPFRDCSRASRAFSGWRSAAASIR